MHKWRRLVRWEFWNFYVVYAAVMVYYVYLSIRAKSFFWLVASNPGIEYGGILGERKDLILQHIPPKYTLPFFLANPENPFVKVLEQFKRHALTFPCIAKPNVGERGKGVEKISSIEELSLYHSAAKHAYVVQTYCDYPLEFGVMYHRMPNETKGYVSSVVEKRFLMVEGDGGSTLKMLIDQSMRAYNRREYLYQRFESELHMVIPQGEKICLEPIGNHVRGTTFMNANHYIQASMHTLFQQIADSIPGFYVGRFDLRCLNVESLYTGEGLKILELNGAGAEPAHIYDPSFSFWEAQLVLLKHFKLMYLIAKENQKNGFELPTLSEAMAIYKQHQLILQTLH